MRWHETHVATQFWLSLPSYVNRKYAMESPEEGVTRNSSSLEEDRYTWRTRSRPPQTTSRRFAWESTRTAYALQWTSSLLPWSRAPVGLFTIKSASVRLTCWPGSARMIYGWLGLPHPDSEVTWLLNVPDAAVRMTLLVDWHPASAGSHTARSNNKSIEKLVISPSTVKHTKEIYLAKLFNVGVHRLTVNPDIAYVNKYFYSKFHLWKRAVIRSKNVFVVGDKHTIMKLLNSTEKNYILMFFQ